MNKDREQDITKYWQDKEREIGEEIRGRGMCEYLGGYHELRQRAWGLLYFTDNTFYVEMYSQKSRWDSLFGAGSQERSGEPILIKIPWNIVKDLHISAKKNRFLALFSSSDYRVFIEYLQNGMEKVLVLLIHSPSVRNNILKSFQNYQKPLSQNSV